MNWSSVLLKNVLKVADKAWMRRGFTITNGGIVVVPEAYRFE